MVQSSLLSDNFVGRGTRLESTGPLFPFVDLQAQFSLIGAEILDSISAVLEKQHFILGPEVGKLEKELAPLTGCSCAVGCASGSDALLLSLLAMGVGANDEVITTPFTFVATASSIARVNARPVFIDIEPETYNMDVRQLQAAITPRTRAIIPVHLFGLPANMSEIIEIAEAHRLEIIEDAAQAIGARWDGKPVGSLGRCGSVSFFPSKNLGGAGDGGMIVTNDQALADRVRLLRSHGSRQKYKYEMLGLNSRLDEIQAAILRVKLRYLARWTAQRQLNADRYRALASKYNLNPWITLPSSPNGCVHVYNQFAIRTQRRDELREYLTRAGIPTEIYYPLPLHLQPAFTYLGYRPGDCVEAERASEQILCLPIFAELTEAQQQTVMENIAAFFETTTERK
jgi:dTDP-4-amino-4,6-dideoxygalactose transaminase